MIKAKLDGLYLTASIDTLQIVSNKKFAENEIMPSYMRHYPKPSNRGGVELERYIINPNKTHRGEIYTLTDLAAVYTSIYQETGVDPNKATRVDVRLDSFTADYTPYLKLNHILLLCLAHQYKMTNRYLSRDAATLADLTIRVQNDRLEAEFYNKALQEPGGDVTTRLELRAKKVMPGTPIMDVVAQWQRRLMELPGHYAAIQDEMNHALYRRWETDRSNRGYTTAKFLWAHRDYIFCRRQLIAFLQMIGCANPESAARHFKARNKVEFISQKDLRTYVGNLCQSMQQFIDS